jgi:hypothetical protein
MKMEARILLLLGVFFGAICVVYWVWSKEDAGGVMLLGGTLLGFLPGSYYWYWSRRMKPRPEDRDDATLEEGEGVIATFPGSSIFPFLLGMGAFLGVLGMVFGIWLAVPGVGLVIWALTGATAESRRGGEH